MKVAILILGNIRTWEQTRGNFLQAFSNMNADIFVHTYDRQYSYHPYNQGNLNYFEDPTIDPENIRHMFTGYNVISSNIESAQTVDQILNEEDAKFHPIMRNIKSSYAQARKLKVALEELQKYEQKHNIRYDFIVKTRTDLVYEPFSFRLNEKTIIIDIHNSFPNDCFYMTNRDGMFKLADYMYNEFYNPKDSSSATTPPHKLLYNSIMSAGLEIERHNIIKHILRVNNIPEIR